MGLGLGAVMLGVMGIMGGCYMLAKSAEMLDNKALTGTTHFVAGITALVCVLGIVAMLYLTVGSI